MNLPRSVPGTAAGLLALALAASLAVGAAVAEEDPPPPPPPAYYGSILVDGDPAPQVASVTAFVDGEQRGCLTPTEAGAYGGPGGFDPKLAVHGTGDDEGKPVAFEVNGLEATPEPSVVWASSDIREVNLTVTEVGAFVACARTSTVDDETVRAEGENAQAGSNVTMDLPSTPAGDEAGVEVTGLEVQLEEDVDAFQLDLTYSPDPIDGTPAPDLEDNQDPLVFLEVAHDFPEGSIAEVTFTLQVERDRLDEAGLGPDEVTLHRYADGSWDSVSTTHVPEDDTDTHRALEATSPGFSVFALGPPEASSETDDGAATDDDATTDDGGRDEGTTADPLAVEAGEVFDADAGQTVEVTGLPAGFPLLTLSLSETCQGCSVHASVLQGPPEGAAVADGFSPLTYLSLEVHEGGDVASGLIADGELTFTVPADDLPSNATSDQVALLHHEGGAWNALTTERTSPVGEDPSTHVAEVTSFSTFATAVDEDPPRIHDLLPEDGTLVDVLRPTIQASWGDERGIDLDTFHLALDGEVHASPDADAGDLQLGADGFTYTPDEPLPEEEEVTVTVTVQDESGLETHASWSFVVDTSTEGDDVTPEDEEDDVDTGDGRLKGLLAAGAVAAVGLAGATAYALRHRDEN